MHLHEGCALLMRDGDLGSLVETTLFGNFARHGCQLKIERDYNWISIQDKENHLEPTCAQIKQYFARNITPNTFKTFKKYNVEKSQNIEEYKVALYF